MNLTFPFVFVQLHQLVKATKWENIVSRLNQIRKKLCVSWLWDVILIATSVSAQHV